MQVGVYSERQAAEIVANVLSALNYLHSCNILHRDIKPENILLASHDSAEVKLSDFGIAKILEEEGEDARSRGRAYTSCGTDYYVGAYAVHLTVCRCSPLTRLCVCTHAGVVQLRRC